MTDLKRKIFDDFDIPPTPVNSAPSSRESSAKKQETEEHRSIPLNYRNFLGAAYRVFEEETLVKIDGKEMNTHMGSMLNQCKQKQASQGDKLMLKLRGLLDYVPKTYKNWERSKMQKMFHRNFMQESILLSYVFCLVCQLFIVRTMDKCRAAKLLGEQCFKILQAL